MQQLELVLVRGQQRVQVQVQVQVQVLVQDGVQQLERVQVLEQRLA